MSAAIIILCLVFLALWAFDRELDRKKSVLGCTHEDLKVDVLRPEYGGSLYLQCKCGYQAHLRCLRPLPDGTWWLMQGSDWNEAETLYLTAYNEHRIKPEPVSD